MTTLKNISILIIALCLIHANCTQESNTTATTEKPHQNLNQINDSNDHTVQHNIQTNKNQTHTETHSEVAAAKVEHEVKQDVQAYQKKIDEIRQEATKNDNLTYEYIQKRINEVIGSMSAEQKQQFQQNLSGEARAAYDHYRKIREQRDRQEQSETQQLKQNVKISKQDQILNAQKELYKKKSQPFQKNGHKFNQLLFQMTTESSQDFKFTLPSDQQILIDLLNYMNQNSVYSPVITTQDDKPIWIYIYQNRDRLVAQSSFYSRDFIHFSGKANTSYLIRFVNHGKHKLINIHMSNLILQSHINDKLTVEDVADHRRRISQVKNQLVTRMNQAADKWLLEEHNQKQLLLGFDHYYFYNIAEIVILGTLCVVQVESIRKLLSNNNVI